MSSRKQYPSDMASQFQIRMPTGLRDRVKASAEHNGRSMNAELIVRLESSFETQSQIAPAIAKLIDDHVDQEVQSRLRAIAAKIGGAS